MERRDLGGAHAAAHADPALPGERLSKLKLGWRGSRCIAAGSCGDSGGGGGGDGRAAERATAMRRERMDGDDALMGDPERSCREEEDE